MTAQAIHVHPIVQKAQRSIVGSAIQQMDRWLGEGEFDWKDVFKEFCESEFGHFPQQEYVKMYDMLISHYLVRQAFRKAEQLVNRELDRRKLLLGG